VNIFEELRADHDRQRELVNNLTETTGESEDREIIYAKLKDELESHAIAEERHFYNPLIKQDKTIELSRHGIAEHHEIDELIEALDKTEMSSPAWLKTAKKLQHKVEHHLDEEEQEFFPVAGKVLSNKEKTAKAQDYREEMDVHLH
jgi:hypothetical protein